MRSLRKLCLAIFAISTVTDNPAHAACVLGMGDSCPISDGEAARLLKPYIDGKSDGYYSLPLRIAGTSVMWSQVTAQENPQALNTARANVNNSIRYLLGDGPCHNFLERPGQPLTQQCEWARFLVKTGFFTLALREWTFVNPQINLDIVAKATERGEHHMKGIVLSRKEGGMNIHPTISLSTHSLRFSRVVRSRNESWLGKAVTVVEFEFERIPNVWAHIEKKVPEGQLGPERRVTQALFEKWSDGWRLQAVPELAHLKHQEPQLNPAASGGLKPSVPFDGKNVEMRSPRPFGMHLSATARISTDRASASATVEILSGTVTAGGVDGNKSMTLDWIGVGFCAARPDGGFRGSGFARIKSGINTTIGPGRSFTLSALKASVPLPADDPTLSQHWLCAELGQGDGRVYSHGSDAASKGCKFCG